ncbi:MAG: DUF11 domain-containing protein, partial [Clostridium sp.]
MSKAIIDNELGVFDQTCYPKSLSAGTIITFTFLLMNTGDVTATNVTFMNVIPCSTSYVANSFTVDYITIPGVMPMPPIGVNIGSLSPGCKITTISFKIQINTTLNYL